MFNKKRPIDLQVEEYLQYCEKVRMFSIQTMRSKRYILRKFAENIGVDSLSKLSNKHIDQIRTNWIEAGVSPRTVNARIWNVIAMLRYYEDLKTRVRIDRIRDLPVDDLRTVFYTPDEISKVKEKCIGMRDLLLISLCFESGLRITELASLKLEQIEGLKIHILGKGGKRRDTFMLEDTRNILNKWLLANDISSGYVFPSPFEFNTHLSTDQVRYIMKKTFKRAGFEKFHPHALRHSTATTLIDHGADIPTTQRIMGHADPKTTMRYVHILTKKLAEKHQEFMHYASR